MCGQSAKGGAGVPAFAPNICAMFCMLYVCMCACEVLRVFVCIVDFVMCPEGLTLYTWLHDICIYTLVQVLWSVRAMPTTFTLHF